MEFEKLYMFNPFKIKEAKSEDIGETYELLQQRIMDTDDIPFQLAKNIEVYANLNYLISEMVARISEELNIKKAETNIMKDKQVYMQRKQWLETNKDKPPAMSYFEALATEFVKDDLVYIAKRESDLKRFKGAYESIEAKQNAIKKKIEAIKSEI